MRSWMTRGLLLAAAGLLAAGPPARAEAGEACASCHAELVASFARGAHARLVEGDWFGSSRGCVSCHAGAEAHAESGDPEAVGKFPTEDPRRTAEICLGCHATASNMGAWPAGGHALAGLTCTSCHKVHATDPYAARQRPVGARPGAGGWYEGCFACHPEVRAQINMPSRHPIREGKMDCGSCHDVHGATERMLKTQLRKNDLCLECHPQHRGPFVFQHAPVEEDCGICHRPHGAAADNLLTQTEPYQCMQCHEAHFHAAVRSPDSTVINYPANPYGPFDNPYGRQGLKRAFLTKCTQCHQKIHGSDQPSQGVSSGGRALSR